MRAEIKNNEILRIVQPAYSPALEKGAVYYNTPSQPNAINVKLAAKFTAANMEFLRSTSTDFNIPTATSFTVNGWYKTNNVLSFQRIINSQTIALGINFAIMQFNTNKLKIQIGTDSYDSTVALSDNTWYNYSIGYDAVAGVGFISINASAYETFATSGSLGLANGLTIGGISDYSGQYLDGGKDTTSIYLKALTIAETTALYNGGNGLPYSQYSASQLVSLISHYKLNERSGIRYDSHGTNHLTDNNTVTYELGAVLELPIIGDSVFLFKDFSVPAYDGVQDGIISQSIYNGTHLSYSTNDSDNLDSLIPRLTLSPKGLMEAWVRPTLGTPVGIGSIVTLGDSNTLTYIDFRQQLDGRLRAQCVLAGVTQWILTTDNVVFASLVGCHVRVFHDTVEPKLEVNDVLVPQSFTGIPLDKTKWFNMGGLDNARFGCINTNSLGDIQHFEGDRQQVFISEEIYITEEDTRRFNYDQPTW